jgi:hypothetical protein
VREQLNRWLDGLPRAWVNERAYPWPAFLSLGVAGYYAALVVTLLAGLWAGRSLLVLLAMAGACAASFFSYALLRKLVTGREEHVLLEHVWCALACAALTLWALGEPLLPYLDAAGAGLCFFLAFGRAGCTMVGCCHGPPSSFGIVYPDAMRAHGFERHLAGVRLFPTQALEMIGLSILGLAAIGACVRAPPGTALFTFAAGYAVLRFGLESLRFDRRPHWLGLSQSRWMALAELAAVAAAVEAREPAPWTRPHLAAAGSLLVLLAAALALKAWRSPRRSLSSAEVREVRRLIRDLAEKAGPDPLLQSTPRWTAVAVSRAVGSGLHLSLSAQRSPWLACQILAAALPEVRPGDIQLSSAAVVHAHLEGVPPASAPAAPEDHAWALYGAALRRSEAPPAPATAPRADYFRSVR